MAADLGGARARGAPRRAQIIRRRAGWARVRGGYMHMHMHMCNMRMCIHACAFMYRSTTDRQCAR